MAVYPEIYTLVRFYRGVDRAAVSRSTVRYTRPICDMPQSRRQQNQPVLVSRNALDAFLVFELLDGPPTKRQNWRVFRYPYIQRDEILQLLETVGVTVIERDYN